MSGFDEFEKKLDNITKTMPELCQNVADGLAGRVLARTQKKTPFLTGRLKNAWRTKKNPKLGNTYSVQVENNVGYATFVEYGHLTRNRRSFVPGFFMLTRSMEEVDRMKTGVIRRELRKILND